MRCVGRPAKTRARYGRLARATACAALCLAALSGCSGASSSFTALSDGVSDKMARAGALLSRPKGAPQNVAMFVASARRKGGEVVSEASFSLQTVSVPPGHTPGAIETPTFGAANPANHFALVARRALEPDAFRAELASHISGRVGNSRDVLVHVHGFNTSLSEARFRLAQVTADGPFTGVAVLFAWPTKGELLAYASDKEAATAARDALVRLLADLAATPGVGRVHILAHSMGSWLTMEALREHAIAGRKDLDGHLGAVMLAAPDIDLAVFRQQVSKLDPSHVSVIVSRDDRALSLSSRIAGDRPRLGAMDPSNAADAAAIDAMGVRVYDISSLASGFVKHDTYANAPDAVRQIGATLARPRDDANVQAVIGAPPAQNLSAQPTEAPRAAAPSAPIVGAPLPPPQ